MKNFFSEMQGITLTFSDFKINSNGLNYIKIYFERPSKENFFDYIESAIPGFEVIDSKGFSDEEIKDCLTYAMRNSFLMWDVAHKNAGDFIAKDC